MTSLIKNSPQLPQWPQLLSRKAKEILSPKEQHHAAESMFRQQAMFADLTEADQHLIFSQMKLETFAAGEVIFTQNSATHTLYMIQEGWIQLGNEDITGESISLGPGNLVGDLDFFLQRPHPTMAATTSKVTLWSLDSSTLKSIVTSHPNIGVELGLALGRGIAQFQTYLANQLARIALLENLSSTQRHILARMLTPFRYLPRDTIYRGGDPATGIFFVQSGTVWLLSEVDEDHLVIGPGDTFGEKTVIYGIPHTYTAQAATEVTVWLLSPADFNALAHSYPSITATLSQKLQTAVTDELNIVSGVLDSEIDALSMACGGEHQLIKQLSQVRRTLNWVKTSQLFTSPH